MTKSGSSALSQRQLISRLFQMTWPMLFGVLSLMSFQLVDTAFIGQLGIQPLATQGFTLPMYMVIVGLQVGLGIATTSLISRLLGKDEIRHAQQLGGLVLVLGAIGMGLVCLLIWFLRHWILNWLDAPQSVLHIVDTYWPYWLTCAWAGAMLYFAYSLCRSHGNTKLPGMLMVVTSLLNMALDPIFIFVFKLGINGAAIATLTAFSVGILIVYPLLLRKSWVTFHWHGLHIPSEIKALLYIMAPAMMSQLLPPISSMLATKLVAGFGSEAVAAWAIGSRLDFFSLVVILALTMSLPPMIGRLFGQKDIKTIQRLVVMSVQFVVVFQLVVAGLLFLLKTPLSHILTSEDVVSHIVVDYLTWVPISLGSLGVCMLMVSVCNALVLPMRALLISAIRLFLCYLPALWLGGYWLGLSGLFMGAMIGNFAAGLFAWLLYQQNIKVLSK